MSMIPTVANPLLGGSLSIGPTGLGGLTGAGLNGTMLPYAAPSYGIGQTGLAGLAGQLPPLGSLPFRPNLGAAGPALPRLGMTGTQALADVATLRPTISSMAPQAADRALASQMGRAVSAGRGGLGLAPGMGRMAMAGRVGGYGMLGQLGSGLIDKTNIGGQNSNLEQGLQGAAAGAGIGAGVGSIVPGLGTGLGALVGGGVGGAIGVLGNMFGGGGDEDEAEGNPLNVLATAISSAQLSPEATENILATYDTLMALAEQQEEGELRDAARQQAFDQTAQLVLQTMQQEQAAAQTAGSLTGGNTLALQQQAAQIFEPVAQDIEAGASLYAQAVAGLRDNLPEQYQAVADLGVARELTQADKLANAYRAQAALTPVANQLSQYQQQADAFARQQYQQMLAQQASGMAGGAGASDILSQLQP